MVYTRAYQATWAAGIIGLCAGLITMLQNMDDPGMIGPGIACAMLGPFYAGFFCEFVIVPLQHIVATRHGAAPSALAVTIAPRRAMYSIVFAVVFAALALFGWLQLAQPDFDYSTIIPWLTP